MEGERGRLKPAATAGRVPMQTGRQRWATVQGKASDQHLRFTAEDVWGRSVEHMGQIQKKKIKKTSKVLFLLLLVPAPCSAASAPCHQQGRGYTAAQALSLSAQLQPGLGRVCLTQSMTLNRIAGNWEISVEKMRITPQRRPFNKENHLNF